MNIEIQNCILYYNTRALANGRSVIEWVNFTYGFFLGKILRLPNEKDKVKRCTQLDIQDYLNQGGRWLKHIRGSETHTSGPVSRDIIRYVNSLGPLDLPEISHYDGENNLRG